MSPLDLPAYKMQISDLLNARSIKGREHEWSFKISSGALEKELEMSLIWVQGTIVDIVVDGNPSTIRISDETGEGHVYDYMANIPGGNHPEIAVGSYIGVIGQLWSNATDVVMKPAKIMVLNSNPNLKTMWPQEIKADRLFLLGAIEPELDQSDKKVTS